MIVARLSLGICNEWMEGGFLSDSIERDFGISGILKIVKGSAIIVPNQGSKYNSLYKIILIYI